ncbi:CDP-glycerol glycerophosphotransferase [Methanobrevibacter gottschalkii]|uniref:CDP-glycerol glycerophosphotransferase n=1 Tax=Methanobrevibacter gottschalkii TaxID=190974 RepID=A0A1H7NED4_9EURY|nr:CDP-glycerol glycerophosphotransferase family protein [Methanobrevibacter gottschalkii]SEL21932.1 CDP-glycerol glycerophosphotransferase [Methanobrevibacter gottschalkii]
MTLKNKINNLKECFDNNALYNIYYNDKIDENIIYLESRNGKDFTGNIFKITEELSSGRYGDFKIYVYATNRIKSKIESFKKNYNLNITKIITDENEAVKILHKAKYIFTDSGIRSKYIKRQGQIFINMWHGIPLKFMGFDNSSEKPYIGIIQRTFFFSDYMLFPNEYMVDIMTHAYMIDKVYNGKFLLEGYPRNGVFLDNNYNIKDKLNLTDKEIFAYMPTFKGIIADRKDEKQKNDVVEFLYELDLRLNDNQILFVKFHPYNQSKIDFSKFNHIDAFPEGFETYDILNIADVLITDYSSVFFDFANTRRKIIIFNYDEKEYLKDRGLYLPLEELPFPKVQNINDLIHELNSPKEYDDVGFVNEFCKNESIDSTKHICDTVINGKNTCRYEIIKNTNMNILIYVGDMDNNQVKNQLIQMLEKVDEDVNIFISFKSWANNIKENYLRLFNDIPQNVEFLPLSYNIAPTFKEKVDLNKFIKNDIPLNENLMRLFNRSYKRQYDDLKFDLIIDFLSNDLEQSLMFAFSNSNNAIVKNEETNPKVYNQFNKIYDIFKLDIYDLITGDI